MSKIIDEFSQALAAIQSSFGRESEEDKLRREEKVAELVAQDLEWMLNGRAGQAALEEMLRTGWYGYEKETESVLDEMLRQRREQAERLRGLIFGGQE